jgi:hypothetical protein
MTRRIQQKLLIARADLQNCNVSSRIDLGSVKASGENESGPKILSKLTGGEYCQNY